MLQWSKHMSTRTSVTDMRKAGKASVTKGTIRQNDSSNPEKSARRLHKAMQGIGTDEDVIIETLTQQNNHQRLEMKKKYRSLFGSDLIDDLKSEIGGNFEEACIALLMQPTEYLVYWLYRAVREAKTNEGTIIEILCSRTNVEIQTLKTAYSKQYGKDLEKVLRQELKGRSLKLIEAILTASREEKPGIDYIRAQKDAQDLYEAGVGMNFGSDEEMFLKILNTRSYSQLRETFKYYSRLAHADLEDAIQSEISGDLQQGLIAVVTCVKNTPQYFADRLHYSLKASTTDDSTIIRILVSRSELDLDQIKQIYLQKYGKPLHEVIGKKTGGDFRKLLLAILKGTQ